MLPRLISLGVLSSILWLVGCTSAEETTAQLYYGLAERRLEVVEINPDTAEIERDFQLELPDLANKGPEGLEFVSNADVKQYGLFGLKESPHGGYFVVSLQARGLVFVVDAPLTDEESETAELALILEIPGLTRDASALYYEAGTLWVVTSKDEKLYRVNTANAFVEVETVYDLSELPLDDPEGFTIKQESAAFADDAGDKVVRYDNFPACLSNNNCKKTWEYDFDKVEPSGLTWDDIDQHLVLADDRGRLITMQADGSGAVTILRTDYDWEGVTVVYQTTIIHTLPLIGETSREYIYR